MWLREYVREIISIYINFQMLDYCEYLERKKNGPYSNFGSQIDISQSGGKNES